MIPSITQNTTDKTKAKTREFVITGVTVDTDENGAGYARQIAVAFDPWVEPNFEVYLQLFSEWEGEEYRLVDVDEIDPDSELEF